MDANVFGKYDFFTGVPDSQLKPLCQWLLDCFGPFSDRHVVAANEGNAVGIAAGYHLATGKVPVVYLQNSGLGNIINPVASLLNDKVYGIPALFVVGWRGEPGVNDEPQHIYQGEVTIKLLEAIGIHSFIIDKNTTEAGFSVKAEEFDGLFAKGKSAAFVVRQSALSYSRGIAYKSAWGASMLREDAIRRIADAAANGIIVSTTGMASRELFEIREQNGHGHEQDFLALGSMGHCSSIALGIALKNRDKKVWIIDGDAAMLMHMGAMATIGATAPKNLAHVVINNASHESVGAIPTAAAGIDLRKIAEALGYSVAKSVFDATGLDKALHQIKECDRLSFLEIKTAVGARKDLGRPTIPPIENKDRFMNYLQIRDETGK
jgi:phosphonopyruvate decarboxylase